MRKTVNIAILALLLLNVSYADKYFVLDVNHIIGSITFNSINVREIDHVIGYSDDSGFLVKTVSFDNSDIENIFYNMSENKKYLLHIPYDKNVARIEVYNLKNSKIMDIDVSSFADTCGNKKCEAHESFESCISDCTSGSQDDFCDEIKDGICDPDCSAKTDIDCEGTETKGNASAVGSSLKEEGIQEAEEIKEKPNYLPWILVIFVIFILALLFFFIKKRKESQVVGSLRQYISENIRRGFTLQQIKDILYREGYTEKEIDKAVKSI